MAESLFERTSVVEEAIKYLLEIEHRNRDLGGESVLGEMVDNQYLFRESKGKGLGLMEKGVYGFRERKKQRLGVRLEDGLSWEGEEFRKKREKELDQQLESVHEHIDRLEAGQAEIQGLRELALEKLKEIECREQSLRSKEETLEERTRVVEERDKETMWKRGEIIRLLDARITAVEEREKACVLKKRELVEMEKELSKKRGEFADEVNLVDERLREQDKLRRGVDERLGMMENKLEGVSAVIGERLKEIEVRERLACESVAVMVKEADLIREMVENRMEELVSKEKQIDVMSKELVKEAEFRDGELAERENVAYKLLDRLELAQENVLNLKTVLDERFKEIGSRETELSELTGWIERKMDEVDVKANELEEEDERIRKKEKNVISRKNEQDRRIRKKEENVICRKNELLMKEQKLELKEKYLRVWKKELKVERRELSLAQKLNEQRLDELERREKNLKSVRDFTSNWFKEHRAVKEKLRSEINSVEQRARDLEAKNHLLERELESTGNRRKNLELKQLGHIEVPDDHVETYANESADLRFFVRMDGKTLQKFLNGPEKDLETVGDEVFTVLHLSSNPAKLVLDAMEGFYPPHLREDDVETNVRKTCIVLLEQLIRMSRKIQPSVREEAVELASSWKSKMRASSENQLEVLGFLHLVAAYDIASCFEKDDISSLIKMVDQCRQPPELCRILGVTEGIGESTDENVKTYSKTGGEEDLKLWEHIDDIET